MEKEFWPGYEGCIGDWGRRKIPGDIFKIQGREIFLKSPNKGNSSECKEPKTIHRDRTNRTQVFTRFHFDGKVKPH